MAGTRSTAASCAWPCRADPQRRMPASGETGIRVSQRAQSWLMIPALAVVPFVDVVTDLVLGVAVALLDLAFELVAAAFDHVEVVVSELSPLLFDLALDLLPIAFHTMPIHR